MEELSLTEEDRSNAPGADLSAFLATTQDVFPVEDQKYADKAHVAAVVAGTIGAAAAATIATLLLSGLLQQWARKKSTEFGSNPIWAKIAIIPSFAQPYNPFLEYPTFQNESTFKEGIVKRGTKKAWAFYKGVARTGFVKVLSGNSFTGELIKVDDFGGIMGFQLESIMGPFVLRGFLATHAECGVFTSRTGPEIVVVVPATQGQVMDYKRGGTFGSIT